MVMVKGAYSKLLLPSMLKVFKASYEHDAINYTDPIIKPKRVHKSYALGFRVTRQMVEDDLYGDAMIKPKKVKMKVVTSYVIDGSFGRLKFENDMFRTEGLMSSLSLADTKELMKAFAMLSKAAKKPVKKIKRRKRVKA